MPVLSSSHAKQGFYSCLKFQNTQLLLTMAAVDKTGGKMARVKARWQLDFSSKSGQSAELPSPPGYSAGGNALVHAEGSREADPNLKIKRSWDLALGPFKQVPMNLFIMYMSGNSISIFPIMMVVMMMVRYGGYSNTISLLFHNLPGPSRHCFQ